LNDQNENTDNASPREFWRAKKLLASS